MSSRKRQDIGKRLRSTDGRMWRVTQILWCRLGDDGRKADCFVHGHGWVEFGGRSVQKMPRQKFQHLKSKVPRRKKGGD